MYTNTMSITDMKDGWFRHVCSRCGYVNYTKKRAPKHCSNTKCRSPYWNVERGTNPRGRPRLDAVERHEQKKKRDTVRTTRIVTRDE